VESGRLEAPIVPDSAKLHPGYAGCNELLACPCARGYGAFEVRNPSLAKRANCILYKWPDHGFGLFFRHRFDGSHELG
jgi:hypothetical protein